MDQWSLGRRGEYLARLYLEEKGMEFIRANYRAKKGEIDLIMRENDELVFLEVKTRTVESARRYGRGALRIDKGKIGAMYQAASQFMREEKRLSEKLIPRFDAVEIYLDPKEPKKVRVLYTPCAFGV